MKVSSAKGWALIGALTAAVIVALGWTLVISPMRSATAEVQDQVASQLSSNAASLDTVAQLKKQSAQLGAEKAKLAALKSAIPSEQEIPTLIRQISAAAKDTGVSLSELTPSSPLPVVANPNAAATPNAPVSGLQEVPLSISVTGTYEQTQFFLNSLERLKRGVLVHGIDLAAVPGGTDGQFLTAIRAGVFINDQLGSRPANASVPSQGQPTPAPDPLATDTPS